MNAGISSTGGFRKVLRSQAYSSSTCKHTCIKHEVGGQSYSFDGLTTYIPPSESRETALMLAPSDVVQINLHIQACFLCCKALYSYQVRDRVVRRPVVNGLYPRQMRSSFLFLSRAAYPFLTRLHSSQHESRRRCIILMPLGRSSTIGFGLNSSSKTGIVEARFDLRRVIWPSERMQEHGKQCMSAEVVLYGYLYVKISSVSPLGRNA